jgi:hypothetical protein
MDARDARYDRTDPREWRITHWHGKCSDRGLMYSIAAQWVLISLLAIGPIVGCASVDEPEPELSNFVPLACTTEYIGSTGQMSWELTVDADRIEAGKPFTARVSGVAQIPMRILGPAQLLLGGFQEVQIVDTRATVHVRSGAIGEDVVLGIDPIPYECFVGRAPCNPENDLPGTPGQRGNSDCQPEGPTNPCGRFVLIDTSTDCDPGGVCDELGWTGPDSQCELNGFCITKDARVPLEEKTARYTAAMQGNVLFGWDDESTGATIEEGGPNDGAWILPPAVYDEGTGPNGMRLTIGGLPVAAECTMGVPCDECFDTRRVQPAPDSEFIALPIRSPL